MTNGSKRRGVAERRGRGLELGEAAGRAGGSSEPRNRAGIAGGRRAEAARPGGLRDVTMAMAMVEMCERAGLPLLAAPLLGSLLPGAPQPGPAQPRFVQGQRCPAGYPPGDMGEELGPSPNREGDGATAT